MCSPHCASPCSSCCNRDGLFGNDGELLLLGIRGYNYDVRHRAFSSFFLDTARGAQLMVDVRRSQVHHKKNMEVCFNADLAVVLGFQVHWLCVHFGQFVAANEWLDRSLLLCDRMLAEPQRAAECWDLLCAWTTLPCVCIWLGQPAKCLPMYTKAGINWHTADSIADDTCANVPQVRPRGDT